MKFKNEVCVRVQNHIYLLVFLFGNVSVEKCCFFIHLGLFELEFFGYYDYFCQKVIL